MQSKKLSHTGGLVNLINGIERNYQQQVASFYMILGAIIYPLNSAISKKLHFITGPQLLYFRVTVLVLLNSLILNKNRGVECFNFHGSNTRFLIYSRSIMGFLTSIFFYSSIQYISLAETAIIFQSLTIWIAIISIFILRTQNGSFSLILSILICFVGLLLVARPQFIMRYFIDSQFEQQQNEENRILGILLALFASFTSTYIYIATYELKKNNVNSQVLVQYFAVLSSILSSLYLIIHGFFHQPSAHEWILLTLFGLFTLLSQSLTAKALMLGKPITMSLLGYIEVVVGYLIDVTIFHTEIQLMSSIGIIMIILGLIILLLNKK